MEGGSVAWVCLVLLVEVGGLGEWVGVGVFEWAGWAGQLSKSEHPSSPQTCACTHTHTHSLSLSLLHWQLSNSEHALNFLFQLVKRCR